MEKPPEPVSERFWAKVDRREPDECWLWTDRLNHDGYGRFWVAGRNVRAHRFAYEQLVGAIPEGMELDHVKNRGCVSRACVNPAHLEPVPHRVNTLRSSNPAAIGGRSSQCKNGHPYTAESTYLGMPGRRICRICNLAVHHRRAARLAAQQVA